MLLVCEDNAIVRRLVARHLDTLKCKYVMFEDGKQGMEWFSANVSQCCGVLTDVQMPHADGATVIAHVKALSARTPCYIMSGDEYSDDQLPPGTKRAFVKPLSLGDVGQIVHEISTGII